MTRSVFGGRAGLRARQNFFETATGEFFQGGRSKFRPEKAFGVMMTSGLIKSRFI